MEDQKQFYQAVGICLAKFEKYVPRFIYTTAHTNIVENLHSGKSTKKRMTAFFEYNLDKFPLEDDELRESMQQILEFGDFVIPKPEFLSKYHNYYAIQFGNKLKEKRL
jgi:hypothetical protein